MIRLLAGDCRDVLATRPAESVHCVVTSPPYYGLRDYGTALWDGGDAGCDHRVKTRFDYPLNAGLGPTGVQTQASNAASAGAAQFRDTCGKCGAVRVDRQIGLEATPDLYLETMVAVFREVRRVLRRDGTCWVNVGDSFCSGTNAPRKATTTEGDDVPASWATRSQPERTTGGGLAAKQLLLMPARLALALQADGWWVRSDIIWHKPNPMPESCGDRPTSAHEHVFLLTRSARYFYDADAVREEAEYGRRSNFRGGGAYFDQESGAANGEKTGVSSNFEERDAPRDWISDETGERKKERVWVPDGDAPPPVACTVLDPFIGAGTTALVADRLQRDCIGIDLNTQYTRMAMDRCIADAPLFTSFAPAEDPEESRMADLFTDMAAD